jgi:hypothetical protein
MCVCVCVRMCPSSCLGATCSSRRNLMCVCVCVCGCAVYSDTLMQRLITNSYEIHYTTLHHTIPPPTGSIDPSQTLAMYGSVPSGAPFPSCSGAGFHTGSCTRNALTSTLTDFNSIGRTVLSVFLASKLVFGFPSVIAAPTQVLLKVLIRSLKTALFLTLDFVLTKNAACWSKMITPTHYPVMVHLITFIVGACVVQFEPAARQSELSTYCAWINLQSFIHQSLRWSRPMQQRPGGLFKTFIPSLCFGIASCCWVWVRRVCMCVCVCECLFV